MNRRLRVIYTGPGANSGETVVERERPRNNRPGWRFANQARRLHGRRKAWQMLTLKINGFRGNAIAELFGTSRSAVYQRLHRLRRGQYAA